MCYYDLVCNLVVVEKFCLGVSFSYEIVLVRICVGDDVCLFSRITCCMKIIQSGCFLNDAYVTMLSKDYSLCLLQ